ncbi:MAG: hypothetical protein IRY83_02430 [Chloroflexi bacterium]|nr:hypothetical protein [Chloroflexota bacterium]
MTLDSPVPPRDSDLEPGIPHHLVTWLEGQRQAEHERLSQLSRYIDQLRDELRDCSAQLARVNEAASQPNAHYIDLVNQIRERLAALDRSVQEHLDAQAREDQARAAQRERDQRQLAELAQQVNGLTRTVDALGGRLLGLAEEVRHLREERAPVAQLLEDLQRSQTALQNRVATLDEITRRYAASQSLAEQADERLRSDIVRLDGLVKLVDVRLTRETGDLRRGLDSLQAQIEDRLKSVAEMSRRITVLTDQRDQVEQRLAALTSDLEGAVSEIGRLDAQGKIDRSALKRVADAVDALSHRLDEVGVASWQLGERLNGLAASLESLQGVVESLGNRIDEIDQREAHLDEEHRRLDEALAALSGDLRTTEMSARDRVTGLVDRLEGAISELRSWVESSQRLSIEHLRRTISELQQQLRELEAERPS